MIPDSSNHLLENVYRRWLGVSALGHGEVSGGQISVHLLSILMYLSGTIFLWTDGSSWLYKRSCGLFS